MMRPGFAAACQRASASLNTFKTDERGAMAVFVMTIFFLMLVFGGIAVDFMRFEIRRVAMQQTLDRAALAAASLTQAEDPQAIVNDYFAKAKLGEGLVMAEMTAPTVVVTKGANNEYRKVNVAANVKSYNYFMGMGFMPVDYLEAPALSQAEQGVSKIEVMLVLDITGSMDDIIAGDTKKKIDGLIEAATLFVNTVKDLDSMSQVSIGVVPYNTQVNLGKPLRERFNATNVAIVAGAATGVANVNCLEPPTAAADFNTVAMSRTTAMPMSVHADLESASTATASYLAWSATSVSNGGTLSNWNDVPNGYGSRYMCPAYAYSEVLLPTKSRAPVLAKIASLKPNGRTSIMMGMRWGAALIDDSARPIYDTLLAGEPEMLGRPADNGDPRTRKIIILMTDGEHIATKFVRDPYKTGLSPIYRSAADNNFSILLKTGTGIANPYWVPHLCPTSENCAAGWRAQPWSNATNNGVVRQLDWSEVWQAVRVTWVARQLYGRSRYQGSKTAATIYSEQLALFRSNTYLDVATMDARLQSNCGATKATGIEVFGIAFGAGALGEAQILGCASAAGSDPNDKSGYFFKPQTSADLAAVFALIASDIGHLKLTQ